MGRKLLIFIKLFILLLIISCASTSRLETESLKSNFTNIRQNIQKDRNYIDILMQKRVGNTGYYYIISSNGVVVAHPQAFLIGANYSRFSFMQDILSNKNGCTSYIIAEKEFTIIHEPLNAEEILCLVIESNELSDKGIMCRRSDFGRTR